MESRIRILRWLSLLLLSAGMTARSRILSRYRWFRRKEYEDHHCKKKKIKNILQSNQIKQQKMKIRIRLLQWLSLLQLSACRLIRSRAPSQFVMFRRT